MSRDAPGIEFFDTSVLVAVFVARHPRHEAALARFRTAHAGEGRVHLAAPSLAELFAVLTRLPLSPRISPALARRLILENLEGAHIVSLGVRDYRKVIETMSSLQLAGGAIYDAIIVQAAIKAGADRLLTLNGRDFRRVWPTAGRRLDVL